MIIDLISDELQCETGFRFRLLQNYFWGISKGKLNFSIGIFSAVLQWRCAGVLNKAVSQRCHAVYRMVVDEALDLNSSFLITVSSMMRFTFLFPSRIYPSFTLYTFPSLSSHFFLKSTLSSFCSVTRDVVEGPTGSRDDICIIAEDEMDAPQDLSLSNTGDRKVASQLWNLSQYYCEDTYLRLTQIVDPANLLGDIWEKHWTNFAKLKSGRGAIMDWVWWQCELNSSTSSVYSLVDVTEIRKFVKSEFVPIFLACRHHGNAVQMPEQEGIHVWTERRLCVNLITCRYRAEVLQAEAIKPIKVASTKTAIVWKGTTSVDVMKALVDYAAELFLQYKVSFLDTWMKNIIEETVFSEFLPTQSCAKYIRYVCFAIFLLKNEQLFPLLERLSEEPITGKDWGTLD